MQLYERERGHTLYYLPLNGLPLQPIYAWKQEQSRRRLSASSARVIGLHAPEEVLDLSWRVLYGPISPPSIRLGRDRDAMIGFPVPSRWGTQCL